MKTILAILIMCLTSFAFADGHLEGEGVTTLRQSLARAITPRTGPMQSRATRVKRKATRMQNSLSNSRRA